MSRLLLLLAVAIPLLKSDSEDSNPGSLREGFPSEFQTLGLDLGSNIYTNSRYIAAWVGQAADRIHEKPNDRDRGQWFKKPRPIRDRENHVWLRAKHFNCQFHPRSLGGIPLHNQVASLDIPEPTKFAEKRSPTYKTAGFGDLRYRESKRNNSNTMDLRGLLGPCMSQGGCDQQTGYELPPLHSKTSSARASSAGGMVSPSAFAVFRLMTSSNLLACTTGKWA